MTGIVGSFVFLQVVSIMKKYTFLILNWLFSLVHCWDYRQQLVKNVGVPNQDEFEFSELKIMGNLSNYSSWHYRSKIISNTFSDETEILSIYHEKYNKGIIALKIFCFW